MHRSPLFSASALLGILSGLVLAGITPTSPVPTKQPDWRNRAAALRTETESLYAWSMPEDLSPVVGHGPPGYLPTTVPVSFAPEWQVRPLPVTPNPGEVVAEPPVHTGNENTIAELEALNDSFAKSAERPDFAGDDEELFGG